MVKFKTYVSVHTEHELTNDNIVSYILSTNIDEVLGEASCPPCPKYSAYYGLRDDPLAMIAMLDKMGLELRVKV